MTVTDLTAQKRIEPIFPTHWPDYKRLLVTDKEASEMLAMGKSTFWTKVKEGLLPAPIKIGGLTRWRLVDLHAAVHGPASPPTTASTDA